MDTLIRKISAILQNGKIENFRQEARWIAEETANSDNALSLAEQRAAGVPLQYLLGTAPFRNLMLKVDSRVLIPRPETELLAQWLIDRAPAGGTVLDLGCGSGAIALSVASERKDLHLTAADISRDALDVAGENAVLCGIKNVEFILSDIFSGLSGRKFDLIGANLPYVTNEEFPDLPAEVRDHEPRLALTAPDAGLALIRQCISQVSDHLNPGGGVIFELSPPQAEETAELLTGCGLTSVIIKDLCGRNRFVSGVLPK